MKKKIKNRSLSILLMATLCAATVIPQWNGSISDMSTVQATSTSVNTIENLVQDYSSSGFTISSGSYVLNSDIENIERRGLEISGSTTEVEIDLNGHSLTFQDGNGPAFYITGGGTLTIKDSVSNGQIIGNTNTGGSDDRLNGWGGCIRIDNGTLNVHGGTISGSASQGGSLPANGGCIHIKKGKVDIYDGVTLTGQALSAGCISVGQSGNGDNNNSCEFNMHGGTVIGKAKSYGGAMRVFGTANIHGGTITGEGISSSDSLKNGGIELENGGTVNMDGGSITGCKSKAGGGGIGVCRNAHFDMSGGEINGNSVVSSSDTDMGGGIYLYSNSDTDPVYVNISGTARITNNIVNGKANNIYMPGNKTIAIGKNFTGQAGVTVEVPAVGRVLTTGFTKNSDAAASHFTFDDSAYQINKNAAGEAILSDTSDAPAPAPTPTPAPSGGSSSSSSSSGSSSSSDSSAPAATNAKPSANGETKVTDSSGKAITNSLVTVKVTDASGNTVSKQVLTDESGNIAKKEVVTVTQQVSANGKTSEVQKTYLACSDGTIYDKPGFAEVENVMGLSTSDIDISDTVVFVNKDGSLKQSEKFTVTTKSGKKIYYAVGDDCHVIKNGFFNAKKTGTTGKSVKGGASYFAGSNGQIITKALFTVKPTKSGKMKIKINKKGSLFSQNVFIDDMEVFMDLKGAGLKNKKGEQYYASASGKIAKGKWVNVGLKEYYCGSNGKITKTR